MAAYPQPNNIHIHSNPQFPHISQAPYIRSSHLPQYPPSYFPIPAGWDPSVSLAHPYIYDPTQVKHRRRTSPEQLKVLEDTFKTDPKPNAALRKQLSLQLGMTPRVLQVWFQNRRMKVKRMVQKCEAAARAGPSEESEQRDTKPEAPASAEPSTATSPAAAPTPTSTENHDSPTSPPPSSRSESPSTDGSVRLAPPPPQDNVRRGSLPALGSIPNISPSATGPQARAPNSPFEAIPDPAVYRRRSMTSFQRLEAHPFAPLLAATNGPPPTHTIIPPTPPAFSPARSAFPHHHHSPSTPAYSSFPPTRIPQTSRAASFHVIPAPQSLHAFHPHTPAQPYAFPPRPLEPPRPGPLPAADYSFGTPPAQNAAQEEIDIRPYIPAGAVAGEFSVQAAAAAAAGLSVPRRVRMDDDTDTEQSSPRFGSIASDTSSSAWGEDQRRGSWATGHVAEMLEGLDMSSGKTEGESGSAWWGHERSTENLVYPEDAYDQQEGGTQQRQLEVPISKTSELAYALCGGSGGREEMLEMHQTLEGYKGHPNVVPSAAEKYSVGTAEGASSGPFTLY